MGSENRYIVRALESLREERSQAVAKLAAYDQAISALSLLVESESPTASTIHEHATPEKPAANQRPLWEEALDLMKARGVDMAHTDVVSGLLARGVIIDSPTPSNIVHSALSRKPDVFVRVKRGVWGLLSSHPDLAKHSSVVTDDDLA